MAMTGGVLRLIGLVWVWSNLASEYLESGRDFGRGADSDMKKG